MIFETKTDFLDTNEEVLPMNSNALPFLCMSSEFSPTRNKGISWHWHSAFEIDYVADGNITFETTESSVTLPKGAAIFFNSNILHRLLISGDDSRAKTYAQFFHGNFLSGGSGNLMESRYIFPVIGNDRLPYFYLYPDRPEDRSMLACVEEALSLCEKEPFGFEFEIRNLICRFWLSLHKRYNEFLAQPIARKKTDESRLKVMLTYMHQHFSEKILLEDLAQTANISTRECSRCFLHTIGTAPMQYLNQYRLEQAAQKLLSTEDSIIRISEDCGFFSNSYFSQCFHSKFGCTPKEYRKMNLHL